MENTALKVLFHRRSVRQYTDEKVERKLLDTVLKAGTYAPTGGGRQQIKIVAVQAEEDVAEIKRLNAAVTARQGDPYYGAGTIVLILAYPENHNADLHQYAECGGCVRPWSMLDQQKQGSFCGRRRKRSPEEMGAQR